MAQSNRVFVSPGVYTSEKDLSFVAQSVGVTTLGLVGETLRGPAFEPILVRDYDEFKLFFGASTPVKDGAGNPKFELPYVAKAYLEESNQLFVTRILGLTGYKPNKTFAIQTLGGFVLGSITGSTAGITMEPDLMSNLTGSTVYGELSGKTAYDGLSITDYIHTEFSGLTSSVRTFIVTVVNVAGVNVFAIDGVNKPPLQLQRGGVYTFDLSYVSTVHPFAFRVGGVGSAPFTQGVVVTGPQGQAGAQVVFTVPSNAPSTLEYYCIAHPATMGNTISIGDNETGLWFVIGQADSDDVNLQDPTKEYVSPLTGELNDNSNFNKNWYNTYNDGVSEVYSYLFVWDSVANVFDVTIYQYSATLTNDGNVVAAFRSRGSYSGQTLLLETTGNTSFNISSTEIETNPFAEFTINVTGSTSGAKSFTCSLDTTSSKYITKVLGTDVFDKPKSEIPVYVYESYPNYLKSAFEQGLVRGISLTEVYVSEGTNFLYEWNTPVSPTVVSEVRGGVVSDLFEVISISDGDAANEQIKISIININLETGEFDLIVRDFNDRDENLLVLEKFTRCSMNPDMPGYIARKVGTSDGEYELRSKYIMLSMSENHPVDAFPAGFKGFVSNTNFSGTNLGSLMYKTKYNNAGDVIGHNADGSEIQSSGDKVRRVTLGLSTQVNFDRDLFKYKGIAAVGTTDGFHLSVNAATITGTTFITTPYDLEGQTGVDNPLTGTTFCKFTFTVGGGFDGWDIYRQIRTYGDGFVFGKPTYVSGHTTNSGVFSTSVGNSDYYSYLQGINTFANPEAVDINIFATPGINFYDHSSLTTQAIDIMENDRADSLYIISSPNFSTAEEVIDALDGVALDTNYSATYWPWIQVRDQDNATQLFIPPTGEVVRNIALTDNVSFPWFAVAGYSRGLVKSIKAVKKLTLDERDDLYKARINPIATFADTGTIIWGNKTLQVRESALDRINVRRLLLRARKLISAVAIRLLFEQNDEQVRNEFLRLVNPILEAIKRERGLFEFRVTVSNDPEDIDANTLRGKIFVKPTRSLEFIDVEFIITPTGASFDNI